MIQELSHSVEKRAQERLRILHGIECANIHTIVQIILGFTHYLDVVPLLRPSRAIIRLNYIPLAAVLRDLHCQYEKSTLIF